MGSQLSNMGIWLHWVKVPAPLSFSIDDSVRVMSEEKHTLNKPVHMYEHFIIGLTYHALYFDLCTCWHLETWLNCVLMSFYLFQT